VVDLKANLKLFISLVIVIPVAVALIGGGVFAPGIAGDTAVQPTVGESVTVDVTVGEAPNGLAVTLTTGNAVAFDADADGGYVETRHAADWRDGSWALAFVGDLNESVNQDAAYTAFAEGNGTLTVMRADSDWLAYYDNGTDSAAVRVPARNQTDSGLFGLNERTSQEPVVVVWDEPAAELRIVTPDHNATATADASPEPRPVTYNWVGTIDEVRLIDNPPTQADIDSYLAEPVAPLPDSEANQTARYMLDESRGTTTAPYYSDTTATVVGGSFTNTGVDGPGLERGTDYELSFGPFEFTALAGGGAAGAPVVHLAWGSDIGGLVGSVAGVLPVLLLLIPLVLLANRITDGV